MKNVRLDVMCLEFDIDELYENQKPADAQQAVEQMDEMFQWLGRGTTRRDWFCGLTDDIDQQSEFHKINLGDFYWVKCINNEEAVKAYEILKGMGYTSSDNFKTYLEEYHFVYVFKLRRRYQKAKPRRQRQ